ncbi:uncharacterized protein KNAG_0H01455 [Huiozyma naganishii CBS 8797]|uniref:DUF659 domain-containing protein n=1 Tax=Huiozyma naganishii (strain ATCC MYA-139 / BCRC 22969 / CBS 8797 / KCTC 17520 / NBRC 10181 / NCYC 3082 / Yp74L-3) TaxID=1071383 RepID=J7S8I6_HUIN7|nr:hypothetical protein KNAG_0H01455 [Kazachstania naganishii CBS 8797]CCK71559.1 hypothetical protein KNAG_0H01455 [Kazachstania naganishii CBS 8797]
MVREQLRKLFDTYNKYLVPQRVQTNGLLSANIPDIIYQRFNVLKKVKLPWVSMETDGWTSNKGTDCISVTINLVTGNMDKACFPIYFSEVETKEKQELTETLLSLIKMFSLSKLLTSCCTDNAASVIGATDSLKGDEQFFFFNSHNGCAVHQIQLFVRALIDDIIENLQTATENTGSENDEEDLESFPNICSVDIVQRLMALTKKLRK